MDILRILQVRPWSRMYVGRESVCTYCEARRQLLAATVRREGGYPRGLVRAVSTETALDPLAEGPSTLAARRALSCLRAARSFEHACVLCC